VDALASSSLRGSFGLRKASVRSSISAIRVSACSRHDDAVGPPNALRPMDGMPSLGCLSRRMASSVAWLIRSLGFGESERSYPTGTQRSSAPVGGG